MIQWKESLFLLEIKYKRNLQTLKLVRVKLLIQVAKNHPLEKVLKTESIVDETLDQKRAHTQLVRSLFNIYNSF